MESQFVPYPIALDLKELGFDEPCFGYFNEKRMLMQFLHNVFYNKNSEIAYARNIKYLFRKEAVYKLMCTAPLWQQVIDWFEQKHEIYLTEIPIYINRAIGDCGLDSWTNNLEKNKEYATRYEARKAAILMAIEIVKDKNSTKIKKD
jgi:hypothetical protein